MPEGCPLISATHDIPDTCRRICEALWDKAIMTQSPESDTFNEACELSDPCDHEVEYSSEFLQKSATGGAALRFYSMNFECAPTRRELFSKTFFFTCPAE